MKFLCSLLRQTAHYTRSRQAFTRAVNFGPAAKPAAMTSSPSRGWSSTPAAMLVHRVKPSTFMPQWAATMASGTVDMPTASAPGDGVLTTGAELIPLAHESFEPGPPSEDAIELARVVDRGIRESGMIDVKQLCIKKGEEIWMVFIDIYALDYDGNLFDASNLAAVCALKNAIVPWKQYGKSRTDDDGNVTEMDNVPMPVTCLPISVTECKIVIHYRRCYA